MNVFGFNVFPPEEQPQVIGGYSYITVGPGQQYPNFEAAYNAEPTRSTFVFLGAVDDSGSIFDTIEYRSMILMAPQSSWDIEDAEFSANSQFFIKALCPTYSLEYSGDLGGCPRIDMGKNGIAEIFLATIEFTGVAVILNSATYLSGGTMVFRDCRVTEEFSGGPVFLDTNVIVKNSQLDLQQYGMSFLVGATTASLVIENSIGQCAIDIASAGVEVDLKFVDLFADTGMILSLPSGIVASVSKCRFLTRSTVDEAVAVAGPLGASGTGIQVGFWDCNFFSAHPTNPAFSAAAAWANAQFYGCTSRNGYDANISFEAGNTSNETS